MLILGGVIHLRGDQNALAHSISQIKEIVDVSTELHRAASMDCTVLIPGAGAETSSYRLRWSSAGVTRADMASTDGAERTLWISNRTMPPDPVWQPAMEFLTPTILGQHMEERYGLMQTGRMDGVRPNEFLLVGRENRQVIEIAVDERTYLPKTLKKYLPESGRTDEVRRCLVEARFQWNLPIPQELLIPASPDEKQQGKH
jgi:hypothetical protein